MSRRVSMQHIANTLGISKYAVSRALAGKSGVSEDTRHSVFAAARALGYRLTPSPQSAPPAGMSNTQPNSLYVLVWINASLQAEPSFWMRVLAGIAAACREKGLEHAIVTPRADGATVFPVYMDRAACAGHLAVGPLPSDTLTQLHAMGGPLVLVDNEEPLLGVDCIVNANIEGASLLTSHLLRQGRRSLLFIGSDAFAPSFRERWLGCRWAVEAFGGKEQGVSIRRWSFPYQEHRWTDGLASRMNSLSQSERPDAFICANDQIALEVMRRLTQLGVPMPEDCAVVGFDNIEAASGAQPALTTVELAKEALGSRAVEQLLRRKEQSGTHPEKVVLAPRLLVRSSG